MNRFNWTDKIFLFFIEGFLFTEDVPINSGLGGVLENYLKPISKISGIKGLKCSYMIHYVILSIYIYLSMI